MNHQLLAHEYQPTATLKDNLYVVTVPYQGRDCTMAELHTHLAEDFAERRSVLTARERKAIALTVPQFAAAAAHYRTGHEHAPRMFLLDEAFAGVDAPIRSSCMGLLHTFDLDFMMTSEREWGCYATLPGLAIYQLATRPGIDAVGLTRWVWNGRERRLAS